MTALILSTFIWGGWQGILLKIAIVFIVVWAINELLRWAAWPIPRPIHIIAMALAFILVIYWLFELFNALA